MPIRFRCVYCNQLLGISRRKAGTIVRCTTCEGQLIVPEPSDPATQAAGTGEVASESSPSAEHKTEAASNPHADGSGGLFEDSEFDAFLEPLSGGGQAVASPPAPSARRSGTRSVPAPASPAAVVGTPDVALTLSRRGVTIAVVAAVLGLGLSFAGGLWLGLAWH